MTPEITQRLRPFMLPNFATIEQPPGRRQDGLQPLPTIHVTALPRETLEALCDDFKARMLARWDAARVGSSQEPTR